MRAVSGPRVIVVGAGVYGLAAARRLALAGADVTVLEAREAGGSFAASAGSSRVLRFEYGALAHYTELVLRARTQWRELERLLGEPLYDETGMLWFAIELSQLPATTRCGRARPPACPCACSSRPRPRAASRRSRSTGVAAVLHDEAGGVLQARRATLGLARLARAAGATLREGVAVRAVGDGVVELADGTQRDGRPGARGHGRLDGRAAGAPIRSTQQVNVYLRLPTAGLPVWTYDLDVYGLSDDGGAGLKVGGHAIGADVDPDDPAAREAPAGRGAAARRGRAPAATGSGLARRGRAAARRRRVLLRADGERGADRRPHRRAHGRVRRVLGPRLQVRADRRGRGAADLVLGRTPEIDLAPFRFPAAQA